jgi:hypothetical protein
LYAATKLPGPSPPLAHTRRLPVSDHGVEGTSRDSGSAIHVMPVQRFHATVDHNAYSWQGVAYLRLADKYLGPLASGLSSVNQPVVRPRNAFATPHPPPVGLHLSTPQLLTSTIIARHRYSDRLRLWPRWHAIEEHFFQRPDMVRYSRRHRRRTWTPSLGRATAVGRLRN